MDKKHNGKRFNDDFRKIGVARYYSNNTVKNLSNEYGVSKVTFYALIRKLTPNEMKGGTFVNTNDYTKPEKQVQL